MKRFLFIILFLSLIGGCAKTVVDTTGNIHGIVTSKETGEPISGASITLTPVGKTTSTGTDGRFEYNDLEAGQYTVQAAAANFQTNSKTVTIVATKTVQCDIQLVPSTPILNVSVTKLDFDTQTSTLSFDISNKGQSTLQWSISEKADWLVCSPTTGNTTTEVSSVVATVSRNGLKGGTYKESLAISSNGGSATINVTLEVETITSQISVTPDRLDFGSNEDVLKLTLEKIGNASSVDYKVEKSNDWIYVDKTSGRVSSTDYVIVSVDRSSVSDGEYSGSVSIIVGEDETVVPVTMEKKGEQRPSVNISEATDVTYSSMQLNGSVISIGSSKVTSHGFCWSIEENPTIETANKCNLGDCQQATSFNYIAQNLEPNTKYYIRTYAVNKVGITYSPEEVVTTLKMPTRPEVSTGEVSEITATSSSVVGTISSLGNVEEITQYGHVWSSTNESPSTSLSSKTELGARSNTGSYSSSITGLEPNTLYYVRAYATNSQGTSYGETKTFTTKVSSPVVTTNDATDITKNSASLNGSITNNGGGTIIEYGFLWGTSQSTLNTEIKISGNKTGSFKGALTNLASSTTYYFKAFAKNENGTSYGEVKSFSTSSVSDDGSGEDFNDNNW